MLARQIVPVWHGEVKNGKLDLWRRDAFGKHVASLDGRVELVIRKHKAQRSSNQNRYLHGVVFALIAEDTGEDADVIKDYLATKFLLVEDTRFPHRRSTADLNTAEMTEFIEQCRRWAATELRINIPSPGEADGDLILAATLNECG